MRGGKYMDTDEKNECNEVEDGKIGYWFELVDLMYGDTFIESQETTQRRRRQK